MANHSGVQQQFLQQTNSFPCKDCGITLNSAESLEVHLQYHKENLLKHWAIQAASSHSEETNNNTTTKGTIKRELITNNTVAAADSSDSMQKKSPEYSRATPENMFGHPPTPQSYQSASSPYQNNETSAFSPNFQNYPQIKTERNSPTLQQQQQFQQNNYSNNYQDQQQYFSMETNQNQQYSQEAFIHKNSAQGSSYNRFHPYTSQQSPYERHSQGQVSSSSPAYPPQPTPSPSPKVCDKCGYVCESATQLIEHLNVSHPPTPAPHLSSYQQNQHFMFDQHPQIKQEDTSQSEILDLDSHKVVHNIYPEEDKPAGGDPHNPHSVSALLNSWPTSQQQTQQQQQEQQKMFQHHQEQRNIFVEQKVFAQNLPENMSETKMFTSDQKLFQPHQIHNQDFLGNNVTTTSQENSGNVMNQTQAYRPFEHMHQSPPTAAVISSTQVPTNPTQPPPTTMQKSSSWKSNEARRPKTYNCTACNKWFTSSGHLKRHYNTTLHKNAVKSSGQPDPASLPISAHHHPARDNSSSKPDDRPQSGSSGDEIRGDDNGSSLPPQFDRLTSMSGLLQQPPNGPYDRQPAPNIHHTPPLHSPMAHSPMAQHPSPLGNHLGNPNLSNGSPPNGEAGLSTNSLDPRGLLSISSPPLNTSSTPHGYNMAPQHLMSMESNQFQMYPNELAPHVMQAMAISNLSTTGEFQFTNNSHESLVEENQPLPSFAQLPQLHRLIRYDIANVGGGGTVTAPLNFYTESSETEARTVMYRTDNTEDYKLTVLAACDPSNNHEEYILGYSPPTHNNNHGELSLLSINSDTEPKIHIIDDTKLELIEDIKQRLEAQPKSPEKAHTKRDYEESTGSPLISSTVKQPGVHKCYDCDKIFNKACYLTQHNKTFHCGDKPYKCSRCGKRFSCNTTFQEHSAKHAGDKPHKCDLCPKQFNHKTDLRRHMCLHTGQKPYACDTCGKGFIRKDHMMKHCETHLRKTQSKIAAIR